MCTRRLSHSVREHRDGYDPLCTVRYLHYTAPCEYLRAGDKGRPDKDGDLWEAKVTIQAEVEQRVHEVHFLGKGGRAEKG